MLNLTLMIVVHFLQLINVMKTQFHFHIDGLGLNDKQLKTLEKKWGFFADDFEHTFLIDGLRLRPSHYTLIRHLDSGDKDIPNTYEEVMMFLSDSNFTGHFQVEMFSRFDEIKGDNALKPIYTPPFKVTMSQPTKYKSHELHLKLPSHTNEKVKSALISTGMHFLSIGNSDFYTLSGERSFIYQAYEALVNWLNENLLDETASINLETTVKSQLFNFSYNQLPDVVSSIYMQ